jgi:biopolymer transport protein ExbD
VVVAGKPLNPDQLKARSTLKKVGPVDVVLAGDKDVPLQMLLGVMDTIRGSGISSVGTLPSPRRNDREAARPLWADAKDIDEQTPRCGVPA